jgi:hypothetical protein
MYVCIIRAGGYCTCIHTARGRGRWSHEVTRSALGNCWSGVGTRRLDAVVGGMAVGNPRASRVILCDPPHASFELSVLEEGMTDTGHEAGSRQHFRANCRRPGAGAGAGAGDSCSWVRTSVDPVGAKYLACKSFVFDE